MALPTPFRVISGWFLLYGNDYEYFSTQISNLGGKAIALPYGFVVRWLHDKSQFNIVYRIANRPPRFGRAAILAL